ncbi:hypothetical protein ACFFHM_03770 [Halalkalibacter kiskunsagensis]|uniref:Uncharacterized protein n=1 Tax=Halalkalibacter kiskunsagensis TaxID=1548599 RepID=A0ABV6K9E3_9BACI
MTTKSIDETLEPSKIASLIRNHITGDLGILENAYIDANKNAIQKGERVLSTYILQGQKVFIITEWDRSITMVLYADEYSSREKVLNVFQD